LLALTTTILPARTDDSEPPASALDQRY
jgi:hypothetical protein